jgi:hypothetical protein
MNGDLFRIGRTSLKLEGTEEPSQKSLGKLEVVFGIVHDEP